MVFLARDPAAERPADELVALKLFHHSLSENEHRLFDAEAQRSVRLRHPRILATYSFGLGTITTSADLRFEHPFLLMDYAEGGSLQQRLVELGPPAPAEAVHFIEQICEGLAYAHSRGLVHQDLKPANVLLKDGQALVADFGIAGALHTIVSTRPPMGSPPYMAPEQFHGKPDARTDVYALAVMAYELFTGRRPFERDTAPQYLHAHCYEDPPRFATLPLPSRSKCTGNPKRPVLPTAPRHNQA